MEDYTIHTNGIDLHYIDYPAEAKPTLLLLHGLTANAHAFDGLVAHGLNDFYRMVAPDLRGRGQSSKPAFCYTFEEHAQDILGLMDHLEIKKAVLCGHSYGGYLSVYLAVNYPERVERIIIMDAAIEMNQNILEMLGPTLSRLDKNFASYEDYLDTMKGAAHNTFWEPAMEQYYRADAHIREDGTVNPIPNLTNIIEVSRGTAAEPWSVLFPEVQQPALLINAVDNYNMDEPLLPDFKAKETVELMQHCTYVAVDGNHHTMLYGAGAVQIIKAIKKFVV